MSEFWDKLETEQRQQRRGRIIRNIVLGFLLLWILSPAFIAMQSFRRTKTVEDAVSIADKPSVKPDTATSTRPATPVESPVESPAVTFEQETVPKTDTPRTEGIAPTEILRMRGQADSAREQFQKEVAQIGLALLERYGAIEWVNVQRLAQQAEQTSRPNERIDAYNQAIRILRNCVPDIRLREVQALIEAKHHASALDKLVKLKTDNPDHAGIREAVQDTLAWSIKVWLDLAYAQADAAPPDDPGFAEVWLPIASATELQGDVLASRDAYRRAWEATERMTNVERAIESAIDLIDCQRLSADSLLLRRRISETAEVCSQVAEPIKRAEYYSDLAGLARLLGDDSLYKKMLQLAIDSASASRNSMRSYLAEIHRCRALSWFAKPEEVLEICKDVPKYGNRAGLESFPANAMCYGYAAIAAARHADQEAFIRSVLLAETQLACVNSNDVQNPFARCVLARADLVARNWRRAVISANNLADPELKASLVYSVLASSPQDVSTQSVPPLLGKRGGMRHAATAVAAFVEHQLLTGHEPAELLVWANGLRHASLRAAAYVGFARFMNLETREVPKQLGETPATAMQIPGTFQSLMDQAERSADLVQLPIDRAYCWILIARTWQRMQKPLSYRRACDEVRTACEQQWHSLWNQRPEPRAGIGDYYYANHAHYYFDSSYRDREAELQAVYNICDCLVFLAEKQAENGDANGAMETCLDAARVSHLCLNNVSKLFFFLRMQAVAAQAQDASRIPQQTLELDLQMIPIVAHYRSCLVSAWSHDLPQLQRHMAEFERDPPRSNRASITARVYAELAVLAAEQKQIELYRTARRSATSLIDRQDAMPELRLMLAEADAYAGELALSENGLTKQTMMWYGMPDRPRSTLIIKLAEAERVDDAEKHYSRLSQPFWKLRAMEAIAKARVASKLDSPETLSVWIHRREDPVDRVGAYCGLAAVVHAATP